MPEAIKAIWEANGKTVARKLRVPTTTMFVSGNLTVAEIDRKLPLAIRSKLSVLYTGDKSLQHDNISDLCTVIINAAQDLHKFLPSLLGLGKSIFKAWVLCFVVPRSPPPPLPSPPDMIININACKI